MKRFKASIFVSTVLFLSMLGVGVVAQSYVLYTQLSSREKMIVAMQLDRIQIEASLYYHKHKKLEQQVNGNHVEIANNNMTIHLKSKSYRRSVLVYDP
ncbi:hypothetical protein [Leuconostoc palmae]|uniref:hypothetical protein n=1 Tax=Leuconostoc palmae TaxID=501487 RepID=UPI001C7CA142|nr:hypothetical protein [Leuconostoc palmae]